MTVKLIVTYINITYNVQHGRHNVHSHCIGPHFLISDLKISKSFMFLILRGSIFHTLDAKYHKEFKAKGAVLRELTENSIWGLQVTFYIS